jgi:hypothetical protein
MRTMNDVTPNAPSPQRRRPSVCALAAIASIVAGATLAAARMEARGFVRPGGRPPKPPVAADAGAPSGWQLVRDPTAVTTAQPDAAAASAADTSARGASLEALQARTEREVCDRWLQAQTPTAPAEWATRADATCARPVVHPAALADAHRVLDAFRWLSGVSSVRWQSDFEREVGDCAVMMDRAERLDHNPSPSWECHTPDGARGAASSNLTLISPGMDAASAIENFVNETVESLGHRRWCLYPALAPTTLGATARALCMRARSAVSTTSDGPAVVAFPNPGFAPIANFRTAQWSVQDGAIDVQGASVRVEDARTGEALAIDQRALRRGYGGAAIAFSPRGWAPQVGASYRVTLALANGRTIPWTTTPVRCGGARSGPGGEPRGWRPAIPNGAIELAPEAAVPEAPGVYVSWSTDDEARVTRTITTVNDAAGARVYREERRVFFRGGGGQSSTRQWSASARGRAITFGGAGLSVQ